MSSLKSLAAATCAAVLAATATPAAAQVEQYVGSVFQFGQNWCPNGWLPANGQLVAISQYDVLYTLYGTTYGGDGQTTFALPDLRARMPISFNTNYPIGAMVGSSTRTVLSSELPAHNHRFSGDDTGPVVSSPTGTMLGTFPVNPVYAAASAPPVIPMNPRMLQPTGGSQSVNIQSPVLAVTWCVAYEGIYPQHP
ncbi:MAG: tail fiber protein [Caulobacter sp.]|nr:tail fiber protein [Caulobacter sp.]